MPQSTKLTGGKLESSLSLERVKHLFTVIQSMNDDDVYLMILCDDDSDDDDVYYYIRWRLKLEGETENMCCVGRNR